MNWLQKNWIIPVLLVVLIAGYFLWDRLFGTVEETVGGNDSVADLEKNTDAFQRFGVTASWNQSRSQITLKAQGNGNAYENTWSIADLRALRDQYGWEGSWGTYWQVVLVSEYSADDDFYVGIILAGEIANSVMYVYVGAYDPRNGTPNAPDSTNAKAALRVDGLTGNNWVTTTLKSPPPLPRPSGGSGSSGNSRI